MDEHGLHVLIDQRAGAAHAELLVEERDLLLQGFHVARLLVALLPQAALERAIGLLTRLVEELLSGLSRRALVGAILAQPVVHLLEERFRQESAVVEQVLEAGGEMNLGRATRREMMEQLVG